jgi:DNA-directed RNA polymerase subunit omega
MPLQNIEDLLSHVDSKYRLVIVCAKRAMQIMRGAEPLVSTKSFKPTYVALDELASGKLQFETEEAQAEMARETEEAAAQATWFRSIAVEDVELAEEEAAPEEEVVAEVVTEEAEPVAPAEELAAEPADILPDDAIAEGEIAELDEAGPAAGEPAEEEEEE